MQALETTDVAALTTTQIIGIDSTTLGHLSDTQLSALTSTQVGVMTQDQIDVWATTPLVLDLNGDGVKTVSIDAGVQFDLRATGEASHVGWVSAQDGFLALDRNLDGKISDGSELFGAATKMADGTTAKDGFEALRQMDSNYDGKIDAQDARYNDLLVWSDTNQDGISQGAELHHLDDLGITEISLGAQATSVLDQGNWIGLESNYTTADGNTHAMADVWLHISRDQNQSIDLTQVDATRIPADTLARIDLSGNGGSGDTVTLDAKAVEKFGHMDLIVNQQTGSGHVQMMIQGDANDTVKLTDASHWHDSGTTVVDGQTYQVLSDGHAQVLIGVKIHHDPIG
jgi:hypothetical protein